MINQDIEWYYNRGREQARLERNCFLEQARTQCIIKERLPQKNCKIADIGGAAGSYAFWLTWMGHTVTLVDPVELHLQQAKETMEQTGIQLQDCLQADARDLPLSDNEYDVVLLLGPLYHLVSESDRIRSLQEAIRILKPRGQLFAAAICRYGSILDGFFFNSIAKPGFIDIMQNDMKTGIHKNKQKEPGMFTTAYFHKPEQLKHELNTAGFSGIQLLSIEGIFSKIPDLKNKWQDESYRKLLLDTIKLMETDQSVIGLSSHFMGFAQKP